MKIGILTYHRAHNYGAVLQAYALRTFLQKQGHDVEFVDYWPDSHEEKYKTFSFDTFNPLSFIQKGKYIISFLLSYRRRRKRRKKFLSFMQNQLGLTKNPQYTQENSLIKERYDLIVYGSDQIWRNHIVDKRDKFDPMYFGENLPASQKIISYAVSMGVIDANEEDRAFLQKALSQYSTILVREKNLSKLVSNLGYENKVVLDPVFLLEKIEWEKMVVNVPKRDYKYILYYQLVFSQEGLELAKKLQAKLNCELIILTGTVIPLNFTKNTKQTASPIEFLSLIKDAEYVITTSFHGTAFSIVFEKQFYSINLEKISGRVQTLLSQMDISDRCVKSILDFEQIKLIDYQSINQKKEAIINESKKELYNALIKCSGDDFSK